MPMTKTDAAAINTLLCWVLHHHGDRAETMHAAGGLAERAYRVRGEGMLRGDVEQAWPATVEVEKLRERVAELEPFEPQLREMNMGPGGWSMTITQAKGASAGFVAAAKGMLDGHGADNYVEQEIFLGETRERYLIIYVRPDGKTPHQLRRDAEAETEKLRAELAKAQRQADTLAAVIRHLDDSGRPIPELIEEMRCG